MYLVNMRAYCSLTLALLVTCGSDALSMPALRRYSSPEVARRVPSLAWLSRDRRTSRPPHRVIESADCFLVHASEGQLFYKAASDAGEVCGVYLVAPTDMLIELVFTYLDVPCEDGGVVAWVDGWELNGEVWPKDAWEEGPERVYEVCGRRPRRVFLSQQNAALIQYRVPAPGRGFSVRVRHVRNARPCDVMLYGVSGVHTMRNFGEARNCSAVAIAPARVRVLHLDVGRATVSTNAIEIGAGTTRHCKKRGLPDHVDIGGSSGLDNTDMQVLESLCGLNYDQELPALTVGCANTVARLVSSGRFQNAVSVAFEPLDLDELADTDLLCSI